MGWRGRSFPPDYRTRGLRPRSAAENRLARLPVDRACMVVRGSAEEPVASSRLVRAGRCAVAAARRGRDVSAALLAGSAADFDTFLQETFTDSFVVIKRGTAVYETYRNGMTPATPHIMFSCTKSFVGLFALMAIEEGRVARDTPIVSIIPELDNGGGFADASFGNVLDMTTSLEYSEDYADPAAEIHGYVAVLGAGVKAAGELASPDLYAYAMGIQKNPTRPHGSVFEYQTPEADVLNWAVNRILGADFIATIEDRIWSKIGMTDAAYVMLDPAGNLFAGGGLNASANDMARFAVMMLDNGRWNGARVVPKLVTDTLSTGY